MADNYSEMTVSPCIPKELVTTKELELLKDEGFSYKEINEQRTMKYYFFNEEGDGDDMNIVKAFQAIIKRSHGKLKYVALEGAYTSSKMRPGEFGGFACLITKEADEWFNTGSWLKTRIEELK